MSRSENQDHERDASNKIYGNIEASINQEHSKDAEARTYEYIVQDLNGNRRRGKTIIADVWNLPEGNCIVVEINKENQPVGDEGGVLGHFCGTIARNGQLCSLLYIRWNQLKKGCERNNEKMILKEVEKRFLYPKALEKWILASIGHKWRDYKCFLKAKINYDDVANITEFHNKQPLNVLKDQWINLVNFWRSDEGQKRSKRGKKSQEDAKVKTISTTRTKSHARVREELKIKLNKNPTRTETYLECHQHEREADVTMKIKNFVAQQGEEKRCIDDDPVSKVFGKDKCGRVRGLGLGVKPSDFGEPHIPPYCESLNMSSKDEAAILYYFHKLKGQVQILSAQLKKQGTTIKKLKRRIRSHYGSDFDDSDSNDSKCDGSDFDEDFSFTNVKEGPNDSTSIGANN